jgi:WD40 repeat protein
MWKNYLFILHLLLVAYPAWATSIDQSPRTAILLKTGNFVAQDTPWSATLYAPRGAPLQRYSLSSISDIEVSLDEKYLLLVGHDGELGMGDLQTGETLWTKGAWRTGLGYIYDASFSGNGKFLAAGDDHGQAFVFESSSGERVGGVQFDPRHTSVMSVALSFDGSTGALITLGEHVFTFNVASGTMQPTGLTGGWPIRFSSDDRYFAFRSDNSGTRERLRVVRPAEPTKGVDLGQFGFIGRIRPTPDGKFHVTATAEGKSPTFGAQAGFLCDPEAGEMKPVWSAQEPRKIEEKTDFDSKTMLGVSTNVTLVTRVFDLRNPTLLLTVDNSANYRRTPPWIFKWSAFGIGFVVVTYVLLRVRRQKRAERQAESVAIARG